MLLVLLVFLLFLYLFYAGPPQGLRPPAPNPEAVAAIRQYLDTNFGWPGDETSWYSAIGSVSVTGGQVTVETTDQLPRASIRAICVAVSWFVNSSDNRFGLLNVRVIAPNGSILANARAPQSCEPL